MTPPTNLHPIHVPDEWRDHDLLTFEQFCALIQIPARTVRDWRRRGTGPRFTKLDGTGRLYLTVAETRRFLRIATGSTSPTETHPTVTMRTEETPS